MSSVLFVFLISLLAVATAMPPKLQMPDFERQKHLQKRSFKAPVPGRGRQGAVEELLRVHKKYDWTIVVAAEGAPLYPISTTTSHSIATASTVPTFKTLTTLSPVPSNSPPTYGPYPNSTSSAPPTPTKGSGDGEVSAIPEENEIQYLAPVTIGGQKLYLNFDSGSSDLWVFSSKLSPNAIGNHSFYDPSKSDTFTPYDNASWRISYGDGSSASGIVGYDVVDVGGSTVQKQAVELATYISASFATDPNSDGLLGLGFSSINTVQPERQKTFFENVMPDLSEPLFTADLEDNMGAGEYEFGRIDKAKYKGDIHYVDIDSSEGWWQFPIPSISIGDDYTFTCDEDCPKTIADTGSSLIYLDSEVVTAYYKQVDGASIWQMNTYIYPCDTALPDLSLQIGDHNMTIKGEDITYLQFDGNEGPAGQCLGGLQGTSSSPQIVGDVFLKQVFAVFDAGNQRFGVAEKN
ncbi:hypothetical protein CBER1_01813 [Cercospora berteroae]|uniref:Peptidase A1 domain-containing protein n=1 Tax=Cercospora berteroae TaxID=357750 RepID=A0A2S6CAD1_9PEZI|nr:hypothetical protein CBER1_01813 [Cercospora berteroae]